MAARPASDPRAYSAGTRAALAWLSRGACYNPECSRSGPIIEFRHGDPYVDFHIAHIRDAKPGNRYDPAMTDDERRAFANLVLLCKPCHTRVDATHPEDYSREDLQEWKREREGSAADTLTAIGPLDEDALSELLVAAVRSVMGNPEVKVIETGDSVRITSMGVLRLLPLEAARVEPGARASPSRLVRARSGIVPFTVHEDLRRALREWAVDDKAFSARVVGGKGGAGKTRLAVQLCEDLARYGWVCGLLKPDVPPRQLEALLDTPTRRLIVVDYAEMRADTCAEVLPPLKDSATTEHPVRVLLLIRAAPRGNERWKASLRGKTEALDALVDGMDEVGLDGVLLDEGGRQRLFQAAAERFLHWGGTADAGRAFEPPAGLLASGSTTPLLVVIAAYLAVHGGGSLSSTRSELLEELLVHEDRYWAKTWPEPTPDPVLRRRVVALATLAGASSETEAAAMMALVPDLTDAREGRRRALARWARNLYGSRLPWWSPLEPDVVAEHLVATTYEDQPQVLAGVLVDDPVAVTKPLRLYTRATPDHAELAAALEPLLAAELPRLCALAIEQARTATDRDLILGDTTVAVALAALVDVTEVGVEILEHVLDLMPRRSDLVLNPLALTLSMRMIAIRRRNAAKDLADEPALAGSLNDLSLRLAHAGRRDEGLTAIQEAVGIYRRLAANDLAYEPDLAMSLSNLSLRLADAGRRAEGLATSAAAVRIHRRLATADPSAHQPALANSLTNLAGHLADARRRDEALSASEQAVAIYRRLARADASAYEPHLASSLNDLSADLAAAGRHEEGLAAIEEAVGIRRRLAAENPAAYLPDLAISLDSLSVHLATADRPEEGLASIEQAVEIHHLLAAANPAAYEPRLAGGLHNLSSRLRDASQLREAVAASEKAVAIYSRLATANPAAYEPDLAMSLNRLSIHLAEADQPDEALAAIEDAVGRYGRVVAARPTAYEPTLAGLLNNLAERLADVGRCDEGLSAIQKSAGIYRRLAAASPAAHSAGLVTALETLAGALADVGQPHEAERVRAEIADIKERTRGL